MSFMVYCYCSVDGWSAALQWSERLAAAQESMVRVSDTCGTDHPTPHTLAGQVSASGQLVLNH